VYYTAPDPLRTRLSRFSVSAQDSNAADPASETVVLEIGQPFANHNGGQIAFGPDGYLYVAVGDGGSGGDPQGNGQNRATLLGKILRIDVAQIPYAIPADNPFAGNTQGHREEIFAYGLRNPWRFSFDSVTGWLWAGDVGQSRYEEIDIIENGKNYGWNIMEANHCYNASQCNTDGLTLPLWEYGHDVGQSVTGGSVYRGAKIPELAGAYIYGDYVTGVIWSLRGGGQGAASNEVIADTDLNIASFGVDKDNEIYICAFDGKVYTLEKVDAGE
jgi:glucose/arabinose dehydrogenase